MNIMAEDTGKFIVLKREGSSGLRANRHVYGVFGHFSDSEEMMDIAGKILLFSDCNVYVQKPHVKFSDEDALILCNEFSFLVFVVSERFLECECFARNIMYAKALEKNVRILPVKSAGSGEIGDAFSRICGKIHLLKNGTGDLESELKNYIDNVLEPYRMVGLTEDQERIRENLFRCKAFISYRKKDIEHLICLLNYIREIPELRDMALFYDSALIPGEDYDQRLKNELSSSDIVIFVVTSNLLENGNYVIREEYPQAVAEGKLLIPVVMDDTDPETVKSVFSAFTELLGFNSPEALRGKLLNVRYGYGEISPMTPEFKHFLAIAYESGEGTERNYRLSNTLLKEAASAGYLSSKARLTIQHLDGIIDDEYEGETEDLLYDAMIAFDKAVTSLPPTFENAQNCSSLARFSDELYNILSKKNGYYHAEILKTIICLEKADSLIRENVNALIYKYSYSDKPNVRFAGLYLFEGNLEEANVYLAKAKKQLKEHVESGLANVYVMEQVCLAHIYKGHLLVKLLLRGDKTGLETVREAHKILTVAIDMSFKLFEALNKPVPLLIVYDECCIARIMQKNGLYDEMTGVFDVLNKYFPVNGYTEEYFDEDYLEKMFQEDDVLCLNINHDTMESWKASLDKYTEWYVMDGTEDWFYEKFSYKGFIPEGVMGDACGNYYVSAYKCCYCNTRLYKTVFPEGNDPRLYLGERKDAFISPSRIFVCPLCGRFFASPKGKKLIQGPVYQASPVLVTGNKTGDMIIKEWWDYFDSIGDIQAKRRE